MNKQPTHFIKLFLITACALVSFNSCKDNEQKDQAQEVTATHTSTPFFKISLAQWSLNKPIGAGEMDPMDFAEIASEMGFEGIEYVNSLYNKKLEQAGNTPEALQTMLDTLKSRSQKYGVENVLIMIDGEGDLATANDAERNKAVENHKKWVDAASFLGAHAVRVNLFGSDEPEEWKKAATDGLQKLSAYAAEKNVNVLVENHGYLSSNAKLLTEVMVNVNMNNAGTLPDFGNFCLKREGGERWEAKCVEEYPKYQGVEEMMPYAKAVSAKSYAFNDAGQETTIDYKRMLQIVKDAGYTGFVGVEYEGEVLTAEEGIMATKNLLMEEGSKLNQ